MPTEPAAGTSSSQKQLEPRKHSRFALVASITVQTNISERLIKSKGMTVEISQGGVSAYLREEFEAGQQVTLQVDLSADSLTLSAVVRSRIGYRYGFQFLNLLREQGQKIQASCKGVPPYGSSLPAE
ncbi:MAG TPA: PilZ domain-containing protein [Terriglobales bacterium]|nr:PilZ domain-containing protein [Terriglobales bacterium]